jgi:tetratricopeptide (TPR) repeat protein
MAKRERSVRRASVGRVACALLAPFLAFALPASAAEPLFPDVDQSLVLKMQAAEKAYFAVLAAGGNKQQPYTDYVMASQRYFQAMARSAESTRITEVQRKKRGKQMAKVIEAWLARQKEALPEGVQAWMWLHVARAYAAAGDVEAACTKGFDKVLDIDPDRFARGSARKWAWQVHLNARLRMAEALRKKATSTKKPEDFQRALEALGKRLSTHPTTAGKHLGIRGRVVRGQLLASLGKEDAALTELFKAIAEARKLRLKGARDPQSRHADYLEWLADQAVTDILLPRLKAGKLAGMTSETLVRAGRTSYRRKKYDIAVKFFQAAVKASQGQPFEKRLTLDGEPKARFYLGIAYHRLEKYRKAQEAYEGALKEFWEKMPRKFREEKKNHPLIARLRDEILKSCAHNGLIAARTDADENPADFQEKNIQKWVDWENKVNPFADPEAEDKIIEIF